MLINNCLTYFLVFNFSSMSIILVLKYPTLTMHCYMGSPECSRVQGKFVKGEGI